MNILWLLWLLFVGACQDSDEKQEGILPDDKDGYVGTLHSFVIDDGVEDFQEKEFVCYLKAPDGSIIARTGSHVRFAGKSHFSLEEGLKEGTYRLLYFKRIRQTEPTDSSTSFYGLGPRLQVSVDTALVLDKYSKAMGLFGEGTEESPFLISSASQLDHLRRLTNHEVKNHLLTPRTHFRQTVDIDADSISKACNRNSRWEPIGNSPQTPFRGIYDASDPVMDNRTYAISRLSIVRPVTAGVGLFGFVENATVKNLELRDAHVKGGLFVGALVGAVQTQGGKKLSSLFLNCSLVNCQVQGADGSEPNMFADGIATGGMVGFVDQHATASLNGCEANDCEISGSYGVGGLVGIGSLFSNILVTDCQNLSGKVKSVYSGSGGLIGSADTLYVVSSTNSSDVAGAEFYVENSDHAAVGFGGIVGGSGISFLSMCINEGNVSGYQGVGGIIGSTRVRGSATESSVYNNTVLNGCANKGGLVEGDQFVGGLCGEAQFAAVDSYNKATVTAKQSYAGGLIGRASIVSVYNTLNEGTVSGISRVGGIAGYSLTGLSGINHNYGDVKGQGKYIGGIIGLSGNDTMINYCGNFGKISNTTEGPTGGIVGEIGDPRQWTAWDIVDCVMGSLELAMALAGPVIAISSEAYLHGLEVAKVSEEVMKGAKKVTYVFEIVETGIDLTMNMTDIAFMGYGIYEMCEGQEKEWIEAGFQNEGMRISSEMLAEMDAIRKAGMLCAIPVGLAGTTGMNTYNDQMGSLMETYRSEEGGMLYNEGMNLAREERYEQVESAKKSEEIVHTILSGICIAVGTALTVSSYVATVASAGAAVSLSIAATSAMVAVVGGANSISKAVDNYNANVAVVSQCVNMGSISASGDHNGGIVGYLQDACFVKDCLNGGSKGNNSSKGGSIVGHMAMGSSLKRCLDLGIGWNFKSYGSAAASETYRDYLYFYEGSDGNPDTGSSWVLSKKELGVPGSYKNWDFNEEDGAWQMPKTNGSEAVFPVPYYSIMQKGANKKE